MEEAFLHYIWKYQYFDKNQLKTTAGLPVNIISPGHYNTDAGPDFLNAKIKVDGMEWYGNVEIHLNNQDWYRHQHHKDPLYDNVILHVCWDGNSDARRSDGTEMPIILLKNRLINGYYTNYKSLIKNKDSIACQKYFHKVERLKVFSMFDKSATERLKRKANYAMETLKANKGDWEATIYQLIAINLGATKNKEPFQQLTQVLPISILQHYRQNIFQVEALIFGMAGYLGEVAADSYQAVLRKEFSFLMKKHKLSNLIMPKVQWLNARMRPGNFPTVRLAQLAAIIAQRPHLYDQLVHAENAKEIKSLLDVNVSDYWRQHYDFGKPNRKNRGKIGTSTKELIIINTLAPLLAALSRHMDDALYMEKALTLLQSVKAEKNHIIKKWNDIGLEVHSAFDSQAAIEIFKNYCCARKCLSCNIGVSLIQEMNK
jgi:hypothetical protein